MTFWKITDTRMNCLISNQEIRALGYNLTELSQNRERTQEFLDILVKKGKEVLGLNTENGVQSFYGAFLPDKSLLLSISCAIIEDELEALEEAEQNMHRLLREFNKEEEGPVLTYQLLFPSLDNVIQFCRVFGPNKEARSSLYKYDEIYYLMVDFINTPEGRRHAGELVTACEFDGIVEKDVISEVFLKEHEKCMIEENAIEKLNMLSLKQ